MMEFTTEMVKWDFSEGRMKRVRGQKELVDLWPCVSSMEWVRTRAGGYGILLGNGRGVLGRVCECDVCRVFGDWGMGNGMK